MTATNSRMRLHSPMNRRQMISALALAGVSVPFIRVARAQAAGGTVHFYSPEANINNFGTLKGEFDAFFSNIGGHKFQPYGDRVAFEKAMESNAGLFFMSSWHYPQLAAPASWHPMLIGRLKDKHTQRHVLCARNTIANIAALQGAKVASAGNKSYTMSVLSDILPSGQRAIFSEQNILPVPKDMDALMAIGFGVAQAAVASESGLDKLAKTNARQHDALTQLAKGPERMLPIVVAPAGLDAANRALLEVLSSMGSETEGQQRLRMLGLDALNTIPDTLRKELGK